MKADDRRDVHLERPFAARSRERCELVVAHRLRFRERLVPEPHEDRVRVRGLVGPHEQVDVDHHASRGIREPPREQPVPALEWQRVDVFAAELVEGTRGLVVEVEHACRVVVVRVLQHRERRAGIGVQPGRERPHTPGPECCPERGEQLVLVGEREQLWPPHGGIPRGRAVGAQVARELVDDARRLVHERCAARASASRRRTAYASTPGAAASAWRNASAASASSPSANRLSPSRSHAHSPKTRRS